MLTNAFRACGICHIEIEGDEDKKQELISFYIERYGEHFYFDQQDWEEYNRKQATECEAEEAHKQRVDALEPIVSLLSNAGRKLRTAEIRFIDALDAR